MELNPQACYSALQARDRRFDGRFFVAVASTKIYCRPICPARTPARERCSFYEQAAEAELNGYRPCLRCRPELAPGNAPVDSPQRLAWQAAERIRAGALGEGESLLGLATTLGVSDRQLRRVVKQRWGVTPVELAQTQRLLLAKQLITETDLSLTEVAFAAGFGSLRRFHSLFSQRYQLSPGAMRRSTKAPESQGSIVLSQSFRPPLAWNELLGFMQRHALAGVELVDADSYARTLALHGARGWIRVKPLKADKLQVEVSEGLVPQLAGVLARVRAQFDLDANPQVIDNHLQQLPPVRDQVLRNPGLRVPGCMDGFELAWRTVLGQQISVSAAARLGSRLVEAIGEPLETPIQGLDRLSPSAEQFLQQSADTLGPLGWIRSRSRAVLSLAEAFHTGRLVLRQGMDPERVLPLLLEHPGVGPWTAHYIVMRSLGWSDAWPQGDGVLRKILNGDDRPRPEWSPWSAYAAMHLWNIPIPKEVK